jgi:light-regulated signal transduction histidine kinase (bacteriophytochrome)
MTKEETVRGSSETRDDHGRTEELERINALLTEREELLRKQAEDLSRSNADLRQFATVAWHDLQEPLRAIGIYAQLLKYRYQGNIDEDADRIIGAITDGVQRMQTLIQALLAFSRASTVEPAPPRASANAEECLQLAIANLTLLIEESDASVDWDPLPPVFCEPDQLTELFQNLLSNAIKYRGAEALRIYVTAERTNGEWLFSVRDNGIGIAAEYHELIFRPFKRLHGMKFPGTGIGLALCHRIVERHGGRIWVESEPGKGAAFRFSLPVEERAGNPSRAASPVSAQVASPARFS